jgi:hypothetical protein
VTVEAGGGAVGAGNIFTGASKTLGKTMHVRIKLIFGAFGLTGTVSAVSVTLPATAAADATLNAADRTTGGSGYGDVGYLNLAKPC